MKIHVFIVYLPSAYAIVSRDVCKGSEPCLHLEVAVGGSVFMLRTYYTSKET